MNAKDQSKEDWLDKELAHFGWVLWNRISQRLPGADLSGNAYADGWNACLDETKKRLEL